jgi:hypothetical protein
VVFSGQEQLQSWQAPHPGWGGTPDCWGGELLQPYGPTVPSDRANHLHPAKEPGRGDPEKCNGPTGQSLHRNAFCPLRIQPDYHITADASPRAACLALGNRVLPLAVAATPSPCVFSTCSAAAHVSSTILEGRTPLCGTCVRRAGSQVPSSIDFSILVHRQNFGSSLQPFRPTILAALLWDRVQPGRGLDRRRRLRNPGETLARSSPLAAGFLKAWNRIEIAARQRSS